MIDNIQPQHKPQTALGIIKDKMRRLNQTPQGYLQILNLYCNTWKLRFPDENESLLKSRLKIGQCINHRELTFGNLNLI